MEILFSNHCQIKAISLCILVQSLSVSCKFSVSCTLWQIDFFSILLHNDKKERNGNIQVTSLVRSLSYYNISITLPFLHWVVLCDKTAKNTYIHQFFFKFFFHDLWYANGFLNQRRGGGYFQLEYF